MYERFTDRARKVMQLANQEAQRFNHEYIGTEHVLLGLIEEGSGVAVYALKNLGVDPRMMRLEVEKLVQSGLGPVTMGKLPQTPRAMPDVNPYAAPQPVAMRKLPQTPRVKKVIQYSMEEARNLGHNYVGTEHMLLGLTKEGSGVAAQALIGCGLTLEQVREEVVKILGVAMAARTPQFRPGFRLSPFDVVVLLVGSMAAAVLGQRSEPIGFIVAFAVAHFFLFCNVFRISRPLELAWLAVFVACVTGTVVADMPGWRGTIAASLGATAVVLSVALREPSYHGIGWKRINPNLRARWDSH